VTDRHPGGEAERRAALAWSLVGGLSECEKARRVSAAGGFLQALRMLPAADRQPALDRAEQELLRCQRLGFTVVTRADRAYPELLERTADPPSALYLWGGFAPADSLALAIVGSRRASPYGLQLAALLASRLAERGLVVVSGLARGIDAAAHRAALEAGGRTLAVLGSGLDWIYPREHQGLAEKIAAAGVVLSEQPLGTPPLAANFPRRNRILSGLALGTLVVEATAKSGSLITTRHALDQNREVFAVPGPVGAPGSEGTHALIQEGAKLVTGAEDVIVELRPDIQTALQSRTRRPEEANRPASSSPSLSEIERQLLQHIPVAGAVSPDRLAEASRLPAGQVLAALVSLELRGEVRSFPGGSYGRKPVPPR
jgi:DNA processing protein